MEERVDVNKRQLVFYFVVVLISVGVGYADTHTKTDDNLPMVVIILTVTFLFGLAQPTNAWQWALIVGLGVPLSHLIGLLIGYHPPYPVKPNVLVTFIALVPAFVGAYIGVLVRSLARMASV